VTITNSQRFSFWHADENKSAELAGGIVVLRFGENSFGSLHLALAQRILRTLGPLGLRCFQTPSRLGFFDNLRPSENDDRRADAVLGEEQLGLEQLQ